MNERLLISSGRPWEKTVGYSRAVRIGPHIWVAGTTSMTPEGLVGAGDAYAQTVQCLKTIRAAIEEAGGRIEHVVRTRIFTTEIVQWEAIGRAHGEVFGEIRPAASMIGVRQLIDPAMIVEIEADAFVPENDLFHRTIRLG